MGELNNSNYIFIIFVLVLWAKDVSSDEEIVPQPPV